jgi:lipopolysaccharide/colanic/teichoic acid biosynthesis glycosyltransferase
VLERADARAPATSQHSQGTAAAQATRATGAAPAREGEVDLDLAALERAEAVGAPAPRLVATSAARVDHRAAGAPPSVEEALAAAARAEAPPRPWYYAPAKRAADVVLASCLLVLTAPLIGLLALVIRLDSKGPAVFRQQRVGKYGELFWFRKFRTMYVDARERFPHLYAYDYTPDEIDSLYFKLAYDPRCTRVGRWLRRTSLDELPNLLNVIKGEMTLVGPRPEIPEMLPFYGPEQLCKFAVTPGMTGLAQVSGRNILRFVETNAKDVEYVAHRSLRFDAAILVRTIWVVVLMIGAH